MLLPPALDGMEAALVRRIHRYMLKGNFGTALMLRRCRNVILVKKKKKLALA